MLGLDAGRRGRLKGRSVALKILTLGSYSVENVDRNAPLESSESFLSHGI